MIEYLILHLANIAAPYSLARPKTMWPALIFAANRNESVSGRTLILTVSIKIKNGFNHVGAPSGRKCATNCLIFSDILEIIIDNHRGRPRDKVNIKCLVILSVYGFRPKRFIVMISINRDVMIVDIPFKYFIWVRNSCIMMVDFINIIKTLIWLVFQNINWVIKMIIIDIVNVICVGIDWLNAIGSKDEKMSGIISKYGDVHLELWRFLV